MKTSIISAVNLSAKKGTHKQTVPYIEINELGVLGDAHAGVGNRQISLLAEESITAFNKKTGKNFQPGDFAENLTVRDLDLQELAILDRLEIGELLLEITQFGKECHGDGCTIFRETGTCIMPKEGVFARVIHGGKIKAGDTIKVLPKPLQILIITLSDRAHAGIYQDLSGPKAKEIIEAFFQNKPWHLKIENLLLPDSSDQLLQALKKALTKQIDIIFTLGGTGVGPRDITPETVQKVCTKIIPGIMENIRIKYGQNKPQALLSRSIAGVNGTTQIYTLPGSVRAVSEYLQEILPSLEHVFYMLHGLDLHG
jgi:molybdopterin adenylyltransferase